MRTDIKNLADRYRPDPSALWNNAEAADEGGAMNFPSSYYVHPAYDVGMTALGIARAEDAGERIVGRWVTVTEWGDERAGFPGRGEALPFTGANVDQLDFNCYQAAKFLLVAMLIDEDLSKLTRISLTQIASQIASSENQSLWVQ